MTITKLLIAGGLLSSISAIASPALAQVPGQYAGFNSDGFAVELVVYQKPSGRLFLTLVREAALFYCDGKLLLTSGQQRAYGAAIIMEVPIQDGVATFAGSSNDLSALSGTVKFDGENISGTLVAYASLFAGTVTPPNDFEAKSCKTHELRFKAKPTNPLGQVVSTP